MRRYIIYTLTGLGLLMAQRLAFQDAAASSTLDRIGFQELEGFDCWLVPFPFVCIVQKFFAFVRGDVVRLLYYHIIYIGHPMSVPIKGWRSFELVIEFALDTRPIARLRRILPNNKVYADTTLLNVCLQCW